MKRLSLALALFTLSQFALAAELPLCEKKTSVTFGTRINGVKATLVKGTVARDMYKNLKASEATINGETVGVDPSSKVKMKSDEIKTCLKIQPARYLDNQYLGLENCVNYRCQILEEN